jgi:hypothetical protein
MANSSWFMLGIDVERAVAAVVAYLIFKPDRRDSMLFQSWSNDSSENVKRAV